MWAHQWFARHPIVFTALLILGFTISFASWALIMPLGGTPDEPAHYVYSSAVTRGQAGALEFLIPAPIADAYNLGCLNGNLALTAACQVPYSGAQVDVLTPTYVGLYNPVFYAVTGIGSIIEPSVQGMYISRLITATMAGVLIGWSASYLARIARSRWALLGILVAVTPMFGLLAGSVNPNSWESAAAIALMCPISVIAFARVLNRAARVETAVLIAVAGSSLAVARGLSLLWIAALIVAVLLTIGLRRFIAAFFAPGLRWAVIVVAAVSIASIVWILIHGTFYVGTNPPASTFRQFIDGLNLFFLGSFEHVRHMYAVGGSLDYPAPMISILIWFAVACGFVALAISAANKRERMSLIFLVAFLVLAPAILVAAQWQGAGWQGRYALPLLGALLIWGGFVLDRRTQATSEFSEDAPYFASSRFPSIALPILWFLSQVNYFLLLLHRYLYTADGTWNFLNTPYWSPPINPIVALGVFTLVTGLLAVGFALMSNRTTLPTKSTRDLRT